MGLCLYMKWSDFLNICGNILLTKYKTNQVSSLNQFCFPSRKRDWHQGWGWETRVFGWSSTSPEDWSGVYTEGYRSPGIWNCFRILRSVYSIQVRSCWKPFIARCHICQFIYQFLERIQSRVFELVSIQNYHMSS